MPPEQKRILNQSFVEFKQTKDKQKPGLEARI